MAATKRKSTTRRTRVEVIADHEVVLIDYTYGEARKLARDVKDRAQSAERALQRARMKAGVMKGMTPSSDQADFDALYEAEDAAEAVMDELTALISDTISTIDGKPTADCSVGVVNDVIAHMQARPDPFRT